MIKCEMCGSKYPDEEIMDCMDYDGRCVYICIHCAKVLKQR